MIYRAQGDALLPIAQSPEFTELGRFPSASQDGAIAFAGTRAGRPGIYLHRGSSTSCLIDSPDFESYRGVLINRSKNYVFCATPAGGSLGVYVGDERILGIGDELGDSSVLEFGLNAVSINEAGHLAICVALADGEQAIVLADN